MVNDGYHKGCKPFGRLGIYSPYVLFGALLVQLFEHRSEGICRIEFRAKVDEVPLGGFGSDLAVPGDNLTVE